MSNILEFEQKEYLHQAIKKHLGVDNFIIAANVPEGILTYIPDAILTDRSEMTVLISALEDRKTMELIKNNLEEYY